MSPISIGVLAFSMSVDAFIAALGRGARAPRPSMGSALRTGAIFGVVEAVTPLVGWAAGVAASQAIVAIDHWIAFALLAGVGLHMILQAMSRPEAEPPATLSAGLAATLVTALGTSLDAMAVGVSLAFLNVNIVVIALAIGCATMVMSSTGVMAGRYLGRRFGRMAEVVGGVALFGLGAAILVEHLGAG